MLLPGSPRMPVSSASSILLEMLWCGWCAELERWIAKAFAGHSNHIGGEIRRNHGMIFCERGREYSKCTSYFEETAARNEVTYEVGIRTHLPGRSAAIIIAIRSFEVGAVEMMGCAHGARLPV